jgi:predicted component of type VI protein secretion system
MKVDTTCALFSKQNEILCNSILSDLDSWLSIKFGDALHRVAFRKEADVRVFIYTVKQRKTQDQVKFNAYASRIATRF